MAATLRRFDPKLAVASLAIACGLVLVGWGVMSSVTGDESAGLPDAIERIGPVPDAVQVPSQTSVLVDFVEGYTGTIEIDGVAYETIPRETFTPRNPEPGQQVAIPAGAVFDEGNFTLTFTAGDEVGFDEFGAGNHQVRVIYWRIDEGPGNARSYTWTFNVV
jgi:hypothetical protein